jgi:hypothetical protein
MDEGISSLQSAKIFEVVDNRVPRAKLAYHQKKSRGSA